MEVYNQCTMLFGSFSYLFCVSRPVCLLSVSTSMIAICKNRHVLQRNTCHSVYDVLACIVACIVACIGDMY